MLKIGDKYYNLMIERKNNKNIYLRVNGDTLYVTAPRWVKREDIEKFVLERTGWIERTLNKKQEKNKTSKLTIDDGIYYLGKKYKYIVVIGKPKVVVQDDLIIISTKNGTIDEALNVYYKEGKNILAKIIKELEPKYLDIIADYGYHLKPDYKFKILKSAWGINYTKRNLIVINERLIHFDERCIEAILWHEMLHFVIPNHSKRFHEVLAYHMPDYEKLVKSVY